MCGLLYLKGQINNAINYLTLYLLRNGLKLTTFIFNAFLSFLYKEKAGSINILNVSNSKNIKNSYYDSLSKKHWETAISYHSSGDMR